MKNITEKKLIKILLLASIVCFYAFGLFHISKFETVDEHFWKYDRVPQYWSALKNREWKKTHINDKPGISVALVSGVGLLFENPITHRIRDEKITKNEVYTVYDSNRTEKINFSLRFPILLFNGLFIFFFFWIIRKITENDWLALFASVSIALSPILIGISQIINPDSLLWSFSFASILSYLALIKIKKLKFLILSIVFTGFSLLSKYSANILFPIFLSLITLNYIFDIENIKKTKEYFLKQIFNLICIFVGSAVIFSIFMPSVFVKSKKLKHLYEGTIGAPGMEKIFPLFAWVILIIFVLAIFFDGRILKKVGTYLNDKKELLLKLVCFIMLFIFSFILINGLTNQKIIPFNLMRNEAYFQRGLIFENIPGYDDNSALVQNFKKLILQFYPFVYSLHPLVLITVLLFWIKIIFKGFKRSNILFLTVFFFSLFPLIYFFGNTMAKVLTNIRYSIMLYPIFSLLAAIGIIDLLGYFKNISKIKKYSIAISLLFVLGCASLINAKPFYFNYTNSLLPKKFIITDAWGYGEYEAAEYLNSLPNPEDLIIWSDRSAICQFLKGKCIRDYKIDLNKSVPDYMVISRRGEFRHKFIWAYPELAKKDFMYYYEKDPEWTVEIGGRKSNFVRIVKSEE